MRPSSSLLEVTPDHNLAFVGPFVGLLSSNIRLRNISNSGVCFKIKLAAILKTQYSVRPAVGLLSPNEIVNVTVSFRADRGVPENRKSHKLLVLSTVFDGPVYAETIWDQVDPCEHNMKFIFNEREEYQRSIAPVPELSMTRNPGGSVWEPNVRSLTEPPKTEKDDKKKQTELVERLRNENGGTSGNSWKNCKICEYEYTETGEKTPRIIECGHTVCEGCLGSIARGAELQCPFCRHTMRMRNGTSSLAKNYALLDN
ncbi:unnamed protein product [Caenorhabditis sp. 36 PRJEB53466]|nr:unnamed protein product [Caenorhabditis sp. 36 PRJEB53466]